MPHVHTSTRRPMSSCAIRGADNAAGCLEKPGDADEVGAETGREPVVEALHGARRRRQCRSPSAQNRCMCAL